MLAGRRLRSIYIAVAFVAAGIFYGAAVVALAMLTDNWYLAIAAVVALIVGIMTFIEPVWGLYLFVAAMFVEGLLALETGATVAKLLGILVFAAWIARSLSDGHFQIILPLQGQFAIAFVVWGLMSAAWAIDPPLVFRRLGVLVQSMALYVMVINLVNSPRRLQTVLSVVLVASLVLAVLIAFLVRSGEMTRGRVETAEISGQDPNNQAAYLLSGAAVLMALFSREARLNRKLILLFGLSIVVLAILGTSSRGAMVALAVVLAFGMVLDPKLRQLMLPALLVGGVAVLVLPPTFLERLESIVTLSDRGAGRIDIWLVGTQIVAAHPLLGIGLGNFGRAFDRYLPQTPGINPIAGAILGPEKGPHNIFVGALSEMGVIGFVLFVATIGLAFRDALTAVLDFRRQNNLHMTTLATSVLLGLLGMLTASMFVDLRYRKSFWLLLALAAVVRRLSPELKGKRLHESARSGS